MNNHKALRILERLDNALARLVENAEPGSLEDAVTAYFDSGRDEEKAYDVGLYIRNNMLDLDTGLAAVTERDDWDDQDDEFNAGIDHILSNSETPEEAIEWLMEWIEPGLQ